MLNPAIEYIESRVHSNRARATGRKTGVYVYERHVTLADAADEADEADCGHSHQDGAMELCACFPDDARSTRQTRSKKKTRARARACAR